jgi:hypothetical protein
MQDPEATQTIDASTTNPTTGKGTAGLDFLDFLFTFVLGFGLVPEALGLNGWGIMSEKWVIEGTIPTQHELGEIATLVVGLLTLTLSWFGYHASVQRKPLNFGKTSGLLRFQIDVLLILLYGLMLINYERTDLVVGMSFLAFILFLVWDAAKAVEYGEPYLVPRLPRNQETPEYRREVVTIFWTFVMMLIWVVYLFTSHTVVASILTIIVLIAYRVHKIRKLERLERLFGVPSGAG